MAQKGYDAIRDDYKTPHEIYGKILEYCERTKFDLDVCCSDENIPAHKYNDSFLVDGLKTEWKGVCFMNPPFAATQKWVRQAVAMVEKYKFNTEVWAVIPGDRLETKYYQDCILCNPNCMFAFLPGKQGFIIPGEEDEPIKPSQKIMIALFTKRAMEWQYSWNFYDWFNTKAYVGQERVRK